MSRATLAAMQLSIRARASVLCVLLGAVACAGRPTQVTVLIDSNADPSRAQRLTITTLYGAPSLDELRSAAGSVTQINNARGAMFPGSFAVVPRAGGARSSPVSLLAVLEISATATQPSITIERMQRIALIERAPQLARMYFNQQCGAAAANCVSVPVAQCTVARRCLEQGLTCGDDGICVSVELPMTPVPPGVALDATGFDASSPRDTGGVAMESGVRDAGVIDSATPPTDSAAVVVDVPRLIAPLSTSLVTSQRPTLRWELGARADGAQVELCRNRAMTSGCLPTMAATGDRLRPVSPLSAGVWFWRARGARAGATSADSTPVWWFRVGARSALADRDSSWGSEADFNGDAIADLAVGAPNNSAGRVYVFNGRAGAMAMSPDTTLAGVAAMDFFGGNVTSAGDVNGDGFADLLVSALWADPNQRNNSGAVSLFLGSAAGVSALPSVTFEGAAALDTKGYSIAGIGDCNGDGYADIAIGVGAASPGGMMGVGQIEIHYGRAGALSTTPDRVIDGTAARPLGRELGGAGDVNNDGFGDMIAGSTEQALVYLGGSSGLAATPATVLVGVGAGDAFGSTTASAGDVNGDGYADVIVGAPQAMVSGVGRAGSATVYLGNSSGVSAVSHRLLQGANVSSFFGASAQGIGDVNNDGYADIAVGAYWEFVGGRNTAGTVRVHYGSANGIAGPAALQLDGPTVQEWFGYCVAGPGDIDGDGIVDMVSAAIVADPAGRMDAGLVRGFRGRAGGLLAPPSFVLEGPIAEALFGHNIAGGSGRSF